MYFKSIPRKKIQIIKNEQHSEQQKGINNIENNK